MSPEDVEDVARTVRSCLRKGEACEMLYHAALPPLRLVFTPTEPVKAVGEWTKKTHVVAAAFDPEWRDGTLDDAVLVSWLGVGAAVLRLAGDDSPIPLLSHLRIAFPYAAVSSLAALGDLLARVCADPHAAAKAAERRSLLSP